MTRFHEGVSSKPRSHSLLVLSIAMLIATHAAGARAEGSDGVELVLLKDKATRSNLSRNVGGSGLDPVAEPIHAGKATLRFGKGSAVKKGDTRIEQSTNIPTHAMSHLRFWAHGGTTGGPMGPVQPGGYVRYLNLLEQVKGDGVVSLNYLLGSPQQAAAVVAYPNVSADAPAELLDLPLGEADEVEVDPAKKGAERFSRILRDWKTVGFWARLRGQEPLPGPGRPQPTSCRPPRPAARDLLGSGQRTVDARHRPGE
jgi:hypothetical protein